jgi:hypothetical protein
MPQRMMRTMRGLGATARAGAALVLALATASCGAASALPVCLDDGAPAADPLVGTWRNAIYYRMDGLVFVLDLAADGTASWEFLPEPGRCSGTLTAPDTWTATSTTLTITGVGDCSGAVVCPPGSPEPGITCFDVDPRSTFTFDFTLGICNDTLVLETSSESVPTGTLHFTRVGR